MAEGCDTLDLQDTSEASDEESGDAEEGDQGTDAGKIFCSNFHLFPCPFYVFPLNFFANGSEKYFDLEAKAENAKKRKVFPASRFFHQ